MSKPSKTKGHVTKRRDGSTYRQDRPAVTPESTAQRYRDCAAAAAERVRVDVEREKRLRILQGLV